MTRDELRADLAELRLEFRTALQGVQNEVAALRTAVADGRTEAARASVAQLRWLVGTIIGTAALMVAALKLLPPH